MLNIFQGIYKGPLPQLTAQESGLAANLRRHVEMLSVTIGDRNLLNAPHNLELAADFLETVFKKLSLPTTSQSYRVDGKLVRNIEAEIRGSQEPDSIVVVGSHYDSVAIPGGCPGANDNASGVAATLELARVFAGTQSRSTIRFVAFVNEEPPYFHTADMGSAVYAQRCRERNEKIVAMLTPETIGYYSDAKGSQSFPFPLGWIYPNVGNFITFIGNAASRELISRVTKHFRATTQFPAIGFAAPMWVTQAGWSDHWSFWKCGYQGLMVTDTAPLRYRHYHTAQDTAEKLDYERMARVVAGLERVVRNESERT